MTPKPVYYAKDIAPGDILVSYGAVFFRDHRVQGSQSFLVLEVKEWKPSLSGDFVGTTFVLWDMAYEEKQEYNWDDHPLVFDEVLKLEP